MRPLKNLLLISTVVWIGISLAVARFFKPTNFKDYR
jgi:uncharacterized protein involved in outer membrane biogenesis